MLQKGLYTSLGTLVGMLLLQLASLTVYAVELPEMYKVKERVADQSADEIVDASKRAIRRLLVRVGGEKKILHRQELSTALQNPKPLIQSFQYQEVLDNEGSSEHWLFFQFEGCSSLLKIQAASHARKGSAG